MHFTRKIQSFSHAKRRSSHKVICTQRKTFPDDFHGEFSANKPFSRRYNRLVFILNNALNLIWSSEEYSRNLIVCAESRSPFARAILIRKTFDFRVSKERRRLSRRGKAFGDLYLKSKRMNYLWPGPHPSFFRSRFLFSTIASTLRDVRSLSQSKFRTLSLEMFQFIIETRRRMSSQF